MSNNGFSFDKRLAIASTPPSHWYTNPAILEQEKATVFARTWQLVGRAEQVAEAGQYFTAAIGDEPVIVVRGIDKRLRAFSNVCRHRAGAVATGAGNCKVFQCHYHGWTYALDGRLVGTPEFEAVECFSKEINGLPQFSVETWQGLVFVNLDQGCAPLSETLEDLPVRISHLDLGSMNLAAHKDWYIECNWKVYVDNYLEGYHIPTAHPSLNRELDYKQYHTETKRFYSVQHSPITERCISRLSFVTMPKYLHEPQDDSF